jgi:predicted nuclease with RNAse H fold
MCLSTTLHVRSGRPDLVKAEAYATEDYGILLTPWYIKRAERMLIQKKLRRLPRTAPGLEKLLQRRLA